MTTVSQSENSNSQALTQKRILLYFLPLAASWLMMSVEMPFINGALARLGEAEQMIAAFGIVAVISITIESPVISLLSTSTALSRNRQHYLQIRKFVIHLMILTTVLHILMGWTRLFDIVIIDWMNTPEILHEPIRLGMKLMTLWSAAIAWRRFTQGILIRYGLTRYVGQGTVIRLLSSVGTATILALLNFNGIVVATVALEIGVIIESAYSHWLARNLIAEKFGEDVPQPEEEDLSYKELVQFHWPLAASNLLFLLSRPMIATALAYGPQPETDLAAWPILSGILFISRAPTIALPEVIIALYEEQEDKTPLQTFSTRVGLAMFGFLILFSFTALSGFYFNTLIGVNDTLANIATNGVMFAIIIPPLAAVLNYFRGALTSERNTLPISLGMAVELTTLGILLVVGVNNQYPGVSFAVAAITISLIADTAILLTSLKKTGKRNGI